VPDAVCEMDRVLVLGELVCVAPDDLVEERELDRL
jgi:hypothetical protein